MVLITLIYIGVCVLLLLVIAALLLLYYARDYAPRVPPAVPGTIRIACVGDSITFGALVHHRKVNCYPAQLEKLLGSRYSVRNFGVNAHAAQKNADKPYWQHRHFGASIRFAPEYVLLMLGTNDASERNWKGVDAFAADYRALVETYRSLPSRPVIYLMTPPTEFQVDNYTKVIHTPRNGELAEITEAIKALGLELSLGVIDVNSATRDHPEFFKFDGIHPDADGARFIAETVFRHIKPSENPA
jgi:lysophospholipase L1-like esterase